MEIQNKFQTEEGAMEWDDRVYGIHFGIWHMVDLKSKSL